MNFIAHSTLKTPAAMYAITALYTALVVSLTWSLSMLGNEARPTRLMFPRTIESSDPKRALLPIIVSNDNILYLNDEVVTLEELKSRFAQLDRRNYTVLIKADRRASLGRVADLWTMCRGSGFSQVNLATTMDEPL